MKKMNKEEVVISLKSVKISWVYCITFLFIWSLYEYITTSRFGISFLLLISQNIVLILSNYILKERIYNIFKFSFFFMYLV
ncbi:hypothetical protein FDB54_07260 [Clostridium botulinum]|nr:hypothetical protein [Clostridium botulinum]